MDGNRDEAERCLEIGERALRDGRGAHAEKFALKAERLYPTQRGRDLLQAARAAKEADAEGAGADGDGTAPAAAARPRKHATPRASEERDKEPDYTPQQLETVRRVNKCKDLYEVLGVTKEATDSDVKKAYKKLALSVHPDKNSAPGANDAFKRLGRAAATLTDPEKRKQYDAFGLEEDRSPSTNRGGGGHAASHYAYARGFDADFNAEEFFNIFFNSAGAHVYSRRGNRFHRETAYHQNNREAQGNYASILQMLPILGLILLSMMSTLFISDPVYSIAPSHKFPVMRRTEHLNVPYYVKENFHNEYQGSLRRLEMSVEDEYVTNLRIACQRERTYRDNMAWKARNFENKQNLYSTNFKMPSCEALNNLQR